MCHKITAFDLEFTLSEYKVPSLALNLTSLRELPFFCEDALSSILGYLEGMIQVNEKLLARGRGVEGSF
jgi:hypothetical protein